MKELKSKKAKEERLEWFTNWLDSVEERVSTWISSLDIELGRQLNGTPESLMEIEKYLLTRFDNPRNIERRENSKELDAITTYIGQVLINHLPDKPRWGVSMVDSTNYEFYFLPYLERPKPLVSFRVFDEIPYLVNMKEGDILIKMYENALNQFDKYREKVVPFKKD